MHYGYYEILDPTNTTLINVFAYKNAAVGHRDVLPEETHFSYCEYRGN